MLQFLWQWLLTSRKARHDFQKVLWVTLGVFKLPLAPRSGRHSIFFEGLVASDSDDTDTMREKTIADLAAQLGICARTFHRRLDRGDAAAVKLHSAETTWRNREVLKTMLGHLAWLAGAFERGDPDLAKAAASLTATIERRIAQAQKDGGRPASDWQSADDILAGVDWSELERAVLTSAEAGQKGA